MSTRLAVREYDKDCANSLAKHGFHPVVARLFAARGISSPEEASPGIEMLHHFTKLKGAVDAAKILADAIEQNKLVVVAGDFDCDGCCGTTIFLRGMRMMGAGNINFIIPDRVKMGYGFSPGLVNLAKEKFNPDLMITVDCGISNVDGVKEANRLGIPVIITDHHLAGSPPLPGALCIVNPNQPGCPFPSKNLCGAGVMFYVMLALRAELESRGYFAGKKKPNLGSLLDIVALATIADVVKLDRNNRILVKRGLERIRAGFACEGLNSLMFIARKTPSRLTSGDLGFSIGPRLNAAGRIDDMSLGVKCLSTDDPELAMQFAVKLNEINEQRKEIGVDMQIDAEDMISAMQTDAAGGVCLFNPSFHQGIVGIVASRIKDRLNRPTIVFAKTDDGKLKGSGRSISGLHLRDTIDLIDKRYPGLIQSFGGHAAACGTTIMETDFDRFSKAFNDVCTELLSDFDLSAVIETDGELPIEHVSIETVESIEKEIWGQGFPQPEFCDEFKVDSQRIVGGKHTKMVLLKDGVAIDAIWFFMDRPVPEKIRAVYSPSINEYNGKKSVQIIIRQVEGERNE